MRERVAQILSDLKISDSEFTVLDAQTSDFVLREMLSKFTSRHLDDKKYLMIWAEFIVPTETFLIPYPRTSFDNLKDILPDSEKVYFIPEIWERKLPLRSETWVFFGFLESIIQVLNRLGPPEYYLVSQDFTWLLGEDHHDVLTGAGEPIISRLHHLKTVKSLNFLGKQVTLPVSLTDKYYSAGNDFWVVAEAQSIDGETVKLVDKWPIFSTEDKVPLPALGYLTATVIRQQEHPQFGFICLLDTAEPYDIYGESMEGPIQFWVSARQLETIIQDTKNIKSASAAAKEEG